MVISSLELVPDERQCRVVEAGEDTFAEAPPRHRRQRAARYRVTQGLGVVARRPAKRCVIPPHYRRGRQVIRCPWERGRPKERDTIGWNLLKTVPPND